MGSPALNPKILYRNSRLLRMVFLQLHRQQRADLFCDVLLQAEGEAVPAHCCILSACSPFFTERLEHKMPLKGHKVVLELQGLKIGPLRKLVDFFYTSEMEVSREEAQDVLAAARQLQVSELESLQLEGGKLVKKALGRHLNRDWLQLSSPVTLPEGRLLQSPTTSGGSPLTSHLLARTQCTTVRLPCTKRTGSNNNTGQRETVKEKPAMLSEAKHQMPDDPAAMSEFLKTKAKKPLAGTVRSMLGCQEIGSLHTEQTTPIDKQATADLQVSKKIKLSRPKLSLPPLPMPCATEDNSVIVSSKTSKSIRRLWRRKSPPVKDEAKEAEMVSHGFSSPPLLPKATKSRKCSSSEPALSLSPPQGIEQIGRVKLRKVINGSSWEIVQEPSAAECTGTALGALTEEGSLPQPRHPEQEVIGMQQQTSSTKLMPENKKSLSVAEKILVGEAGSVVSAPEGDCVGKDSYQLLMPDQLAEGEGYDNLASAEELENMLDLLLADDAVESQGTTVTERVPTSGHAPKLSNTLLGNAGAEEKLSCSAEVSVHPQWVKAKQSPLQGVEGYADFKTSKGTLSLTNGVPFLDPVHGCLPLTTFHSSNDCIPLCSPTSPPQDSWTAHQKLPVMENGATRLATSLPTHKNQRLLSSGATISGGNTKPEVQPLQHHLDCKLPRNLAILEEDEIDIGGVEEYFNIECVRPDPSPVSENEVDVVNY